MFTQKIDEELEIALVEQSFAPLYLKLVQEDLNYLDEWLAWPRHCTGVDHFESFISDALHGYADGISMVCGVIYNGSLVGTAGFNKIDRKLSVTEIGYWLSSRYQGYGIVTRVCYRLMEIAFEDLKIDKVQISPAEKNLKSRAICERLNMVLEGVISNCENLNGRIVSHAIYGMHQKNWSEHKAALNKKFWKNT